MTKRGVAATPFSIRASDTGKTWSFGDGGPTVTGHVRGLGLVADGARQRWGSRDGRGRAARDRGVVTYTGEAKPGGSPQVRELSALTITKLAVDPKMSNNCYLLTCRTTGSQVLIDAADQAASLIQLCDARLDTVVTTHQHWDHHRALAEVVDVTGAEVVAGAPDADAITEQTGVPVTRRVQHGDTHLRRRLHPGASSRSPGTRPARSACRTTTPAVMAISSPAMRCFPEALARRSATPTRSTSSSPRSSTRSSAPCPTTPGSTPATATTRRSAPSDRTLRSGAPEGGECP